MFRYRCPHCTKLLQAPEVRAGKTTVCSKCSQALTIPADRYEWLNERGEPLLASPTFVIRPPSELADRPPAAAPPEPKVEADNDVLGAISTGEFGPLRGSPSERLGIDVGTPSGRSSALSALLGDSFVGLGAPASYPPESPPALLPRPVDAAGPATVITPAVEPEAEPEPPAPPREEPPAPATHARESDPPGPADGAAAAGVEPRPAIEPEPEPELPGLEEVGAEAPPAFAAVVAEPPPEPPVPASRPPLSRPVARKDVAGERPASSAGGPPSSPGYHRGPLTVRTRRLVATVPTPARRSGGDVSFDPADQLRNQMTVAADLTAALTTRMKPPRRAPRDLLPSTALWLLATGAALALIAATLLTPDTFTRAAAAVGAAEVAAGYAWIVWLTASRGWLRGAACVVPPVTFWFLGQSKYAKFRPLRFVATGVVVILLAAAATYAQAHTRTWAGVPNPGDPPPEPPAEIATQSKLAQLRHYRDERAYDALVGVLRTLSGTDATYSQDAKDRAELTAELKALCGHKDSDVKIEAMKAYAVWGGAAARGLCLAATRSTAQEERVEALKLLTKWKDDPEVARAVASRVGRPGTESARAQEALVEMGGPVAERATIPLLSDSNPQGVRLVAVEILGNEAVGGAEAVAALRYTAATSADPGLRQPAAEMADRIEARLRKK